MSRSRWRPVDASRRPRTRPETPHVAQATDATWPGWRRRRTGRVYDGRTRRALCRGGARQGQRPLRAASAGRRRRAWAGRRDLVPNDGLGLRPSLVISGLRSTICHGGLGMAAHRRMQGARPDGGRHRGKIDGIPCVTRIHGGFWGQDLPALLNLATSCCRTDDEVAITVGRGGYFDRFLRGCLLGSVEMTDVLAVAVPSG